MSHQYITAWRLHDGAVVYLGTEQRWVLSLNEAEPYEGAALDAALSWARGQEGRVVDPYVIPVDTAGAPSGRRVRESIRAVGPTVRPDLARS